MAPVGPLLPPLLFRLYAASFSKYCSEKDFSLDFSSSSRVLFFSSAMLRPGPGGPICELPFFLLPGFSSFERFFLLPFSNARGARAFRLLLIDLPCAFLEQGRRPVLLSQPEEIAPSHR